MSQANPPQPSPQSMAHEIDKIIFRCFDQGVYWGTGVGESGDPDPDYKPDNPIDRTKANKLLIQIFISKLEKLLMGAEGVEYPHKRYGDYEGKAIPTHLITELIRSLHE